MNCIPAPDAVLTYSCPFPCSSPGLLLYSLQVAQTLPHSAQSLGLAAQNRSQDIPGDSCAAQSMLRYPHQLKYLWQKLGILNITDIGVFKGNQNQLIHVFIFLCRTYGHFTQKVDINQGFLFCKHQKSLYEKEDIYFIVYEKKKLLSKVQEKEKLSVV